MKTSPLVRTAAAAALFLAAIGFQSEAYTAYLVSLKGYALVGCSANGPSGVDYLTACSSGNPSDQAAINKAINATRTGKVYIAKGDYYLASTVLAKSNVTIECESPGSTTLHAPSGTLLNLVTIDNVSHVAVRNCGFDGNLAGNPQGGSVDDSTGNDIEMHGASGVELSGNRLTNAYAHGIFVRDPNGNTGVNIHDNIGTGNGCRFIHSHGNDTYQNKYVRVVNNTGYANGAGSYCRTQGNSGIFAVFANDRDTVFQGNIEHDEPGVCFAFIGQNSSAASTIPAQNAAVIGNVATNCGTAAGAASGIAVYAAGGSSTHSYAPSDTITLAGGTNTAAAVATVSSTKLVSVNSVASAGSGCTNGTQTFTGTTGTGTKFVVSGTVSGNALASISSITTAGSYTVNPTTLTAEPVTGASCSVAPTLSVNMGVNAATIGTAGTYSALPSNPVAQSTSSGVGTGAQFAVNWSGFPGFQLGGGLQNVAFTNNFVTAATGDCFFFAPVATGENTIGVTIDQPHGHNCGGSGIKFNGGSQKYQAITITNVDLEGNGYRGIELSPPSGSGVMDKIQVRGGYIGGNWGQAFYVGGTSSFPVTNVTAQGLTIELNWREGALLSGMNQGKFLDNTLIDNAWGTGAGIVNTVSTTSADITNNFVYDSAKTVTAPAFLVDGNSSDVTLTRNRGYAHGTCISYQGASNTAGAGGRLINNVCGNTGNLSLSGTSKNVMALDNYMLGSGAFVDSGTNNTYSLRQSAHVVNKGTAPSVATGAADCGTTPGISGNDTNGRVTVGTSPGSKCTLTFAVAYATAPSCVALNETTGNLIRPTATTTTLTLNGTMTAADSLSYICNGY